MSSETNHSNRNEHHIRDLRPTSWCTTLNSYSRGRVKSTPAGVRQYTELLIIMFPRIGVNYHIVQRGVENGNEETSVHNRNSRVLWNIHQTLWTSRESGMTMEMIITDQTLGNTCREGRHLINTSVWSDTGVKVRIKLCNSTWYREIPSQLVPQDSC